MFWAGTKQKMADGQCIEAELAAALEELERKRGEVRILEEKIAVLKSQREAADEQQRLSSDSRANPSKKRTGVPFRKGRQEKGGGYSAGRYEETMWDPKLIMPALGVRPVGHIRTCFPRKNGEIEPTRNVRR